MKWLPVILIIFICGMGVIITAAVMDGTKKNVYQQFEQTFSTCPTDTGMVALGKDGFECYSKEEGYYINKVGPNTIDCLNCVTEIKGTTTNQK